MKPSTYIAIAAAGATLAAAVPVAQAGPLGGRSSQGEPVIGKVVAHRAVAITAAFDQRCGNGTTFYWQPFRSARLTHKRTFAVGAKSSDTFDDGYTDAESYSLSGRVAKNGVVNGIYQVRDAWYAPDGSLDDVCNTGRVRFSIRDAGVLAGRTSAQGPTVLELDSSGTHIKSLLIPWTADCKSGQSMWNTASFGGSLEPTGAFAASLTPPSFAWGNGQTAVPSEELSGQITKSGASGTWRVKASIVDANGTEVDSCDSGPLAFHLN